MLIFSGPYCGGYDNGCHQIRNMGSPPELPFSGKLDGRVGPYLRGSHHPRGYSQRLPSLADFVSIEVVPRVNTSEWYVFCSFLRVGRPLHRGLLVLKRGYCRSQDDEWGTERFKDEPSALLPFRPDQRPGVLRRVSQDGGVAENAFWPLLFPRVGARKKEVWSSGLEHSLPVQRVGFAYQCPPAAGNLFFNVLDLSASFMSYNYGLWILFVPLWAESRSYYIWKCVEIFILMV